MAKFLKCFLIAFVPQVLFLLSFHRFGVGEEIVYFFYLLPYAILSVVMPFGRSAGPHDCDWCLLAVLVVPAVLYSAVFALIVRSIQRYRGIR